MNSKSLLLHSLQKRKPKITNFGLSASALEKKTKDLELWEKRKANFDKALYLVNEYLGKNMKETGKNNKWKELFEEYSIKFQSILGDDH
jgi:hypothetical protein